MLSKADVFLVGLRALRNTLVSAVDQIDLILDAAERTADSGESGECSHPMQNRVSKATMGHPNRFHCTACNQDVEE